MSYALSSPSEFSYIRTDEEPLFLFLNGVSKAFEIFSGIKKIPQVLNDINNVMEFITLPAVDNITVEISPYEGELYKTLKPISVKIELLGDNEYVASFEEANVSFAGDTATEAVQALRIEILEVYDLYKNESRLGPGPKRQLAVLENYVVKKGR